MTYAEFDVDISDAGDVASVELVDGTGILDPGWTPPFNRSVFWLFKHWVPDKSMEDSSFYPGELGKNSAILVRRRHPNTTINEKIPAANVVASALIFFRAGDHTDRIGLKVVKCPYHVPWVWCEWLVAYRSGKFTVYGTGSVFPTHTFYAQAKAYEHQDEPTDAAFVTESLVSSNPRGGWIPQFGNPLRILTSGLKVYPVLITGAPSSEPLLDTTYGSAGPASSVKHAVAASGYSSVTTF
ncbi:MAG: hypothetical protein JO204_20450 [Alphaproteobacteria bacterium]|nr:hypothetical protein [Alphaproteobacteria bacterium]